MIIIYTTGIDIDTVEIEKAQTPLAYTEAGVACSLAHSKGFISLCM
jgi:hypothetical protein